MKMLLAGSWWLLCPSLKYARMFPRLINPLTPELNPSEQRCLPEFFRGDFKF
jgi:hypothetical protein